MPAFRLEHVFDCNQTTFWEKVFFDAEYNRRLFFDELHFSEWNELEQKHEGERVVRLVRAVPPAPDLPGPLKAALGNGVGYEERGVFERSKHCYDARVRPNSLGDRVAIEFSFRTEPMGEQKCRRIVAGTVAARVMLVGGMLEQRMISDLQRSYEKSAVFTNRFVAEKGLS
jgi:hypothetical protein